MTMWSTWSALRKRISWSQVPFWMLKRPIADAKIRALVQGRDLFEGRRSRAVA
jgi:hypothetical protein